MRKRIAFVAHAGATLLEQADTVLEEEAVNTVEERAVVLELTGALLDDLERLGVVRRGSRRISSKSAIWREVFGRERVERARPDGRSSASISSP